MKLLAAAFCLLANTLAISAEPPAWEAIGDSQVAHYDRLISSVEVDADTGSVQYLFRTTYKTPVDVNGVKVKSFVENVLLLCGPDLFITTNQLQYDETGKAVGEHNEITVYHNPLIEGHLITQLLVNSCGPASAPPSLPPVTKNLLEARASSI
jgi:hypothetical protein